MKRASLRVDKGFRIGEVTDQMYGDFNQAGARGLHFHVPGHPLSEEHGFRMDYMEEIKKYGMGFRRFPGGSNMSMYEWKHSIGPKEQHMIHMYYRSHVTDQRPTSLDDCFVMSELDNTKVMLNLRAGFGTATITDIFDLLDYCLTPSGSYWSELRAENGHPEPYKIDYVCIGNEEDGDWELAQHTPESYGHFAREAAKVVKYFDPNIKVVLCGTSNPAVATYPEWDRIVLDMAFDYVDLLSIHYIRVCNPNFSAGVEETPLGIEDLGYLETEFGDFIDTTKATIQFIKAKHKSQKDIRISIEEWAKAGIPDRIPEDLDWSEKTVNTQADLDLLGFPEGIPFEPSGQKFYSIRPLIDAIMYAQDEITMLNHADCVALSGGGFSNAITVGESGLLKTVLFYAAESFSHYGKGYALKNLLKSPLHDTQYWGQVTSVKTAAVYNEEKGEVAVFAINTNLRDEIALDAKVTGFEEAEIIEHMELWDPQPLAGNSFSRPERILPRQKPLEEEVVLQPLSFHVLRYKVK